MKAFNEIKQNYQDKNYTLSDLKKSIIFFSIVRFLFTETFLFLVSAIPFLIGFGFITSIYGFSTVVSLFYLVLHLIFYVSYVKGQYTKNMLPTLQECDMTIKALKEIKSSK